MKSVAAPPHVASDASSEANVGTKVVKGYHEGVDTLIRAWRSGRTIVPLIGAGISVDSGIPAITGVVRYLAKVHFYLMYRAYLPHPDADGHQIAMEDYLAALGWPDPYQLDADLWRWFDIERSGRARFEGSDKMEQVVQITLRDCLSETEDKLVAQLDHKAPLPLRAWLSNPQPSQWTPPSDGDQWQASKLSGHWRALLGFVTQNHPGRTDALFQQLVRDRFPGTSHRFLAFLARIMEWKLVLTMNFDTLIEDAMNDEGLRPDVYEVWQDAELPDPALLANRLSVVKLHGGLYGLTVGERLDQPLDEDSKQRLLSSLPPKSLILVLGWAGWDRRVMDLVQAILHRAKDDEILWVQFEKEDRPKRVQNLVKKRLDFGDRVLSVRTLALSEFLREAHTRVANSHARSHRGYAPHLERPLGIEPPCKPEVSESKPPRNTYIVAVPEKLKAPAADTDDAWAEWFTTHTASDDAALAMSSFLSERNLTYTPIWVNAESFQSVGGIIAEIVAQLRLRDVHLPPLLVTTQEVGQHSLAQLGDRPGAPGAAALTVSGEATVAAVVHSPERDSVFRRLDPALERIIEALQRGRYALAIDGIGSFGRPATIHHGACRLEDEALFERNRALFEYFIVALVRLMNERASDSIVLLAFDVPTTRYPETDPRRRAKGVKGMHALVDQIRSFCDRIDCQCAPRSQPSGPADPRLAELMPDLVAFRRPRSIVAVRNWLTQIIYRHEAEARRKASGNGAGPAESLDDAERDKQAVEDLVRVRAEQIANAQELDVLLRYEEEVDALLAGWNGINRMEGGAYWMDTLTRDNLYAQASSLCTTATIQRLCASAPGTETRDAARQLRRLRDAHDRIARYYYSDYYLATRHIECLMEYFYHRVASLRFHAMHAALLMAHSDRAADLLDPGPVNEVERGPGSEPAAEPRELAPASTPPIAAGVIEYHVRRCEDISALARVIYREEDALFSKLSSETLYDWIVWVQSHDLKRLAVWHLLPAEQGREAHAAVIRVQQQIADMIGEIGRILEESRLRVLIDRSEFTPFVLAVRRQAEHQIRDILELVNGTCTDENARVSLEQLLRQPETVPQWVEGLLSPEARAAREARWLDDRTADPIARYLESCQAVDALEHADQTLLTRLYDHLYVELVLDGLVTLSGRLLELVQARKNQNRFNAAAIYQAAASKLLAGIEAATMRSGDKVELPTRPASSDDRARRLAQRFEKPGPRVVLNLLRSPGPHALLDGTLRQQLERLRVRDALAQADLLIAPFSRWEAKGQSLETRQGMMIRLERAHRCCIEGLEKVRAVSSVMGSEYLLTRSYFHTVKARVHALRAEFSTAHAELDKAAAGLNTNTAAACLSLAVIQIRHAEFSLMRSDFGFIYKYAYSKVATRPDAEFLNACSELARGHLARHEEDVSAANIKRLLRRSLAFWPEAWLTEISEFQTDVQRAVFERTLSSSRQRLRRCEQALARAHARLNESRRSVHWWRLYYQTCAQYHFESLMLLMTQGPEGLAAELRADGDQNRVEVWLHMRVLDHLRRGLRAVRNALESIPAEHNGVYEPWEGEWSNPHPGRDRRSERLVQLWYQFLIVKLAHETIRRPNRPAEALDVDYFWNCWRHLVDMENAWVVPGDRTITDQLRDGIKHFLTSAAEEAAHLKTYDLATRAFVERQLYHGFGVGAGTDEGKRILNVTFGLRE